MNSRKLGRFKISYKLLDDNWQALKPLFANVVVVRAEARYDALCIEYVGLSDWFDEVPLGEEAPLYNIEAKRWANGDLEFVCVKV